MSITIDEKETQALRRALLEDLPSFARQIEDVAREDAGRLRWCLWQELLLLRGLGWRSEMFERERDLDGACLLGIQEVFRRANGVLVQRVGSDGEEAAGVLDVCERFLTALAIVSTPELAFRLGRRPHRETELLKVATTIPRADAEVLRRQLVQMTVARVRRDEPGVEDGLRWMLDDLRLSGRHEPSSYLLTAPAPVIARTLTCAVNDACSWLRVLLSADRRRGPALVALSAVALCARLCERAVRLGEGEGDVA